MGYVWHLYMSFRATLFFKLPYQWHIRLSQFDERADRCRHKLSTKARLCALPIMQNHNNDGVASSTRKSVGFSRRARRGSEKGERESSITIGNKSKADATIARRACRDGWPVPQPPRGQYDCFRQVQSDTRARICPIVTFRCANFGFLVLLRWWLLSKRQFNSFKATWHDKFFQRVSLS